MKKLVTLITLITLLLLVTTSLFAVKPGRGMQGPGRGQNCEMGQGDMMMAPEMLKDLKLTADQKKSLETIKTTHHKEMIQLNADLEKKMIDMRQAMKDEKYSEAKKINKEIVTLHGTIADKRIDMVESMMKILTPEQKEICKNRMHQGPRMGKMEGKREGKKMMKEHCDGKEGCR